MSPGKIPVGDGDRLYQDPLPTREEADALVALRMLVGQKIQGTQHDPELLNAIKAIVWKIPPANED